MSDGTKATGPNKLAPWLVILTMAGMAATYMYFDSAGTPAPVGNGPAAAPRPESQIRFCDIIDQAAAAYEPVYEAWDNEKNPIAQDRMEPKMASMRQQRDKAVLALLGKERPHMEGWIVHLVDMSTGINNAKRVSLRFTARCHALVTLNSDFDISAKQGDILAAVQRGDYLRISGRFLSHDADANPPERALNWDGFESTAMRTPSYLIVPTDISNQ